MKRNRGKPLAPERAKREEVDVLVNEVIEGLQHLLVRCGYTPEEIADRFKAQLERIPAAVRKQGVRAASDFVDIPHVMTLWANDPVYLSPTGTPLALPVRGKAPSIESLASRVNPSLQIQKVVTALRDAQVVVKRGGRYFPITRVYSYRHDPMNQRAHSLRSVKGLLHTLNHNIHFRPDQVRWFQYIVENPNVPVRAAAKIYERLFARGARYLEGLDDQYVQLEKSGSRRTRRKRIAWQIHYWEDDAPASSTRRKRTPI